MKKYSRQELESMTMVELRKLALNYNVKTSGRDKASIVQSLFLQTRKQAPRRKLALITQVNVSKQQKKVYKPKLNNAIDPMTLEQPIESEMNQYLIIFTNEKTKTYVKISDFLQLAAMSTHRHYEIKRTKIQNRYEKYIDREKLYINISLPFNAIVSERDIMKINPGGLQVFFLEKTNIKLGELISQDVANRQGSLVGSHHGGDWLYTLRKQERAN